MCVLKLELFHTGSSKLDRRGHVEYLTARHAKGGEKKKRIPDGRTVLVLIISLMVVICSNK